MRPNLGTPPPVPDVRNQAPAGKIRQVRRYELITPLFGGGVEPKHADLLTPVRGSEIRGQLRFWWRACRGGEFDGNLQKMKEAEDQLWGAAGGEAGPRESQVQIILSDWSSGSVDVPFDVGKNQNGKIQVRPRPGTIVPAYAAFPLQPEQRNASVGMKLPGVQLDVKFTLTITYPQDKQLADDIEAALWAWETFGGIGGRTRRGFGALCCTHINNAPVQPPRADQLRQHILAQLQKHVSTGQWPADVPHLVTGTKFKLTAAEATELAAWQFLIERLKSFRQRRASGVGNRPGRSHWPEPDEIRRRFPGKRHAHTPRPESLESVAKFPRAAFGLPIVFHFKDKGDPPETTLQGAQAGRLASPLILRPIRCNQGAAGIGLILEGSRGVLKNLKLGSTDRDKPVSKPIATQLIPAEAATEPLKSILGGNPDVLTTFLDTL